MLQIPILLSLSLAFGLVQGLVVPELSAKNIGSTRTNPRPLALGFTVESSVGNMSVSEWKNKLGLRNSKRSFSESIQNSQNAYFLDVYLGSNQQKSKVLLDTGSSDLWVPSSDYDPRASTSAKATGHAFNIQYVDGSSANGEYFLDRLAFDSGSNINESSSKSSKDMNSKDVNNKNIKSTRKSTQKSNSAGNSSQIVLPQFVFAAASADSFGVFGIADRDQESSEFTYNNLPWALQKAELIPKASYSLYLGPDHESGMVIFGGVDTEKYSGPLTKYDIDKSQNSLSIDLQTVSVGGQHVSDGSPYVLDSGTSLALVSEGVLNVLYEVFNVDYNGFVNCNQPRDQYIDFSFGRNSIKVPYTDAVYSNGDGTCSFAFSYENGYTILGDIFLRNAYVYYDLSDQTISLAQVKYSSASKIVVA